MKKATYPLKKYSDLQVRCDLSPSSASSSHCVMWVLELVLGPMTKTEYNGIPSFSALFTTLLLLSVKVAFCVVGQSVYILNLSTNL